MQEKQKAQEQNLNAKLQLVVKSGKFKIGKYKFDES